MVSELGEQIGKISDVDIDPRTTLLCVFLEEVMIYSFLYQRTIRIRETHVPLYSVIIFAGNTRALMAVGIKCDLSSRKKYN